MRAQAGLEGDLERRWWPTVVDFCCPMSSPRLFFKELVARQDWSMAGGAQGGSSSLGLHPAAVPPALPSRAAGSRCQA